MCCFSILRYQFVATPSTSVDENCYPSMEGDMHMDSPSPSNSNTSTTMLEAQHSHIYSGMSPYSHHQQQHHQNQLATCSVMQNSPQSDVDGALQYASPLPSTVILNSSSSPSLQLAHRTSPPSPPSSDMTGNSSPYDSTPTILYHQSKDMNSHLHQQQQQHHPQLVNLSQILHQQHAVQSMQSPHEEELFDFSNWF